MRTTEQQSKWMDGWNGTKRVHRFARVCVCVWERAWATSIGISLCMNPRERDITTERVHTGQTLSGPSARRCDGMRIERNASLIACVRLCTCVCVCVCARSSESASARYYCRLIFTRVNNWWLRTRPHYAVYRIRVCWWSHRRHVRVRRSFPVSCKTTVVDNVRINFLVVFVDDFFRFTVDKKKKTRSKIIIIIITHTHRTHFNSILISL